ncbi:MULTISPECIES: amidohydrolase family protein [unclassified Leifsonia]|uniref:amidohydrolase family protein n=1 Tax=unclassified Leifsonia TaxID=2663824 RepID=UPI000701A1D6|nr:MULTISPECIES: amidohydrolase family protein [unclassified Leifsonia]KQX08202.1 imidazolonepropionase [Leifsonia sp. Root1293]KRA12484.1 imidazolonepropionase [Leifsonia sp. Root60]
MRTAIVAGRVFDGTTDLGSTTVVIADGVIESIGDDVPADAEVVLAPGATLLPGLIDSHVHTDTAGLRMALQFGVTTELEMQGANTARDRTHISEDDSLADVRSAGFGLTPPGGHPEELFPKDFNPQGGAGRGGPGGGHGGGPGGAGRPPRPERVDPIVRAKVTSPEQAVDVVGQLARAGSDYIKFMVDDGSVEGHPGLPMLDQATLNAGVAEAHRLGMLTVAHALTIEATQMSIDAGIDGLAHLFMDQPHTPQIIDAIAQSGAFVVACVVLDASMMGITGSALADDPRVAGKLSPQWDETLRSSFNHYPQGRLEDVLATVRALDAAGVDLLIGTDVSQQLPFLGGLAHGASVHQELQYFVDAGLSPVTALSAATAVAARRFGLTDRGTIAVGQRADLLLVDGDPTTTIGDTLNIRGVWRRGIRQPAA